MKNNNQYKNIAGLSIFYVFRFGLIFCIIIPLLKEISSLLIGLLIGLSLLGLDTMYTIIYIKKECDILEQNNTNAK